MELGALTGHGPSQLTAIADGDPIIAPQNLTVLGHRHPEDLEDACELALVDEAIVRVDARELRERGPAAVAPRAERDLRQRTDAIWLHLDLDVLDQDALPAVSYPQPRGLSWNELVELLTPLTASARLIGMSIPICRPTSDPEGIHARRVTEVIAVLLADA
jgi:arginase